MSRPPSALRNLGPKLEAAFAKAGVTTAEELIAMGPEAAYARLLATGMRPHFAVFWALTFAIQDRPWSDLGAEEKAVLRGRFDAVVAARSGSDPGWEAVERELDRFGVGQPSAQPTSSRPEKK